MTLLMIIPLLALAVVMIIRVVVLRVLIAFSPLLILAVVYEFNLSSVSEKASLKSIVGLVFLPVFVVFAVSMSIIFLSLIQQPDLHNDVPECKDRGNTAGLFSCVYVSCDGEKTCYDFCNISTFCFTKNDRLIGANILDIMSWLIAQIFGIALTWTMIFFALKSSSITNGVVNTIEGW